jgi:uncharacterized integral membrane protein
MKAVAIMVTTLAVALATVTATLATASGAINAVNWACHNFGAIPVALAGAFIAGATIMHAIDRALAVRHRQSETRQAEPEC